ncbi:AlpA family transcriptional regulator [Streptomyces sp. VRA16 Mangrove soil]|uniref:helix-turn-helix transcriptional regulator n=1 Tax=Streptomyces sp. VRA16 Mangrove soil TaxID=2817434 RepID=UPI001A9DBD99|nr:helix-turn-helix domain-containing protein [Streptomyces sp. VRA16 Mangrove soil]
MKIARDFRVDREELRSSMVATALEVWADTVVGVPPRHVRDRMVKAAFEVAWQLGNPGSFEYPADDIEVYDGPDASDPRLGVKAASILDLGVMRDADFAEQISGERFGALFERLGHFDAVQSFHDEIRSGRRSGSVSQSKASGLHRYWISNSKHYYYASDLYPPYVGLREAATVMGIAESAARRLIGAGQFPFPVARAGRSYKISVRALMHFKEIPDAIVYVDDVENGALHARGGAA